MSEQFRQVGVAVEERVQLPQELVAKHLDHEIRLEVLVKVALEVVKVILMVVVVPALMVRVWPARSANAPI